MNKSTTISILMIALFVALWGWTVAEGRGNRPAGRAVDHDRTAFPLTGHHKTVECEACHTAGRYEGLPTQCSGCHQVPMKHIVDRGTSMMMGGCNGCHSTVSWAGASFQHDAAKTAGRCDTCHNGRTATGKPSTHLATTAQCDTCHTTKTFSGTHYQHDATAAGRCDTCHNGRTATGKPSTHVATTAQCDSCHTTKSFVGAAFRHDASAAGRCDTCHNGRTAPGKPSTHIVTTAQCDGCHTTTSFVGAAFRHDASAAGRCDTCHNGRTAPGKPTTHLATTAQCDTCHRMTGWVPASYSNHTNPQLIGGHSNLECRICHPRSFATAFYRDGVQYGSCSNCHRRDYRYPGPDEHRNRGTTFDTSLQLNANCANCHRHAGYREF